MNDFVTTLLKYIVIVVHNYIQQYVVTFCIHSVHKVRNFSKIPTFSSKTKIIVKKNTKALFLLSFCRKKAWTALPEKYRIALSKNMISLIFPK